ncbi:hypothetical protein RxyAA322_28280 [Rubrobacter xylanophilus]|uniref:Cysteine dioxygenase n=2 Tax=Rubrobacter xylanophilus TaxID=49319 RepID=A0A510HM31_9ACTN|nr:hypothetical protein RxyAA322_28280 [Rubrobacter xylanophilus]
MPDIRLPQKPTVEDAADVLRRISADRDFLGTCVLPLLGEAAKARGWYVAHSSAHGPCTLQVFVWPPGTATRVHDHSSWGAFCCVAGSVVEERYGRLDDGRTPEHARLRRLWRRRWGGRSGISTVLPYEGGIHRLANPSAEPAVSVHLYGPRSGKIDGRDYAPLRDYVCDRV